MKGAVRSVARSGLIEHIVEATGGEVKAAALVGALAGGALAMWQRNRHARDDRATHITDIREFGHHMTPDSRTSERIDRYSPAVASVSDMLEHNTNRPTLIREDSRSLETLLDGSVTDLSHPNNRGALAHKLGELEARLLYSPRVGMGYLNFSEGTANNPEYTVEQQRLNVQQRFAEGREALIDALLVTPSDPTDNAQVEAARQIATQAADNLIVPEAERWEQFLDDDRRAKNRSFRRYKARSVAWHGARGAAIGFVTGTAFSWIFEHLGQHGGVKIEQKTKTVESYKATDIPGQTPATIDGEQAFIPDGTQVVQMPDGTDNLIIPGHPQQVVVEGIAVRTNSDGAAHLTWDTQTTKLTPSNITLSQGHHTHVTSDTTYKRYSFRDLATRIKGTRWYHKAPPSWPNGNEEGLHTVKLDDKTVKLVPEGMGVSQGEGLPPLDVPQAAANHQIAYAFVQPAHSNTPVIADAQRSDGSLTLNTADVNPHDVVTLQNGQKVPEGVFSRLVVDPQALAPLHNGDIATQATGHEDVFAVEQIHLGVRGPNGTFASIATIDGSGAPVRDVIATQMHNHAQVVYDRPVVRIDGQVVSQDQQYTVKTSTPVVTPQVPPLDYVPMFRDPLNDPRIPRGAISQRHPTPPAQENTGRRRAVQARRRPVQNPDAQAGVQGAGGAGPTNRRDDIPAGTFAAGEILSRFPDSEKMLRRFNYIRFAVARGVPKEIAAQRYDAITASIAKIGNEQQAQQEQKVTMLPTLRDEYKTLFTEKFKETVGEETVEPMLAACIEALYSAGEIPSGEEAAKAYITKELLALAAVYIPLNQEKEKPKNIKKAALAA